MISLDELTDLRARCLVEAGDPNAYKMPELYFALTNVSNAIMDLEVIIRMIAVEGTEEDFEPQAEPMSEEDMDAFEGQVLNLFAKEKGFSKALDELGTLVQGLEEVVNQFEDSVSNDVKISFVNTMVQAVDHFTKSEWAAFSKCNETLKNLVAFEGSLTLPQRQKFSEAINKFDMLAISVRGLSIDTN